MKRYLTKDFWNTPLADMHPGERLRVVTVLMCLFTLCIVIATAAAWKIIY